MATENTESIEKKSLSGNRVIRKWISGEQDIRMWISGEQGIRMWISGYQNIRLPDIRGTGSSEIVHAPNLKTKLVRDLRSF